MRASGGTHASHQSGDPRDRSAPCPTWEPPRPAARSKPRRRPSPPGRQHRQGARRDPAPLVRAADGEPGRPGDPHDRRAGQAARRVQRRNRLRGLLHRVVRRGRQAPLRRHHPQPSGRQAHAGAAPAGGRGRGHHALEFPAGDDHAQGRPGARRGLHLRVQAGDPDALLRARDGGAGRSAPAFRRGAQHRHRRVRRRSAAKSPPTRRCASSPSPAPPPSARSSWRSAPAR